MFWEGPRRVLLYIFSNSLANYIKSAWQNRSKCPLNLQTHTWAFHTWAFLIQQVSKAQQSGIFTRLYLQMHDFEKNKNDLLNEYNVNFI